MPKRSTANQLRPRLNPPPTLTDAEAKAFRSIVASLDPEFFAPSDVPLLVEYVRASAQADIAATALAESGAVVNGRASPWIVVQEKSVRSMVALAARLRLSPQSSFDRLRAGTHSRDQIHHRLADADDPLHKWRPGPPPTPSALDQFRNR